MKRHLFYTFLWIFIATSALALLGVTGVIHIVDGYLGLLVTAFLTQLAAAVIAVFRAAKFFENEFQESKVVTKAIAPHSSLDALHLRWRGFVWRSLTLSRPRHNRRGRVRIDAFEQLPRETAVAPPHALTPTKTGGGVRVRLSLCH